MKPEPCSSNSLLTSLPTELVTEIINFCSWKDIIHLSQTCKSLQLLCQTRSIWTSLLSRLHNKESPSLPPYISLSSLSTPELKSTILKGLKTNKTWTRYGNTLHPTSVKELRLPKQLSLSGENQSQNQWSNRLDLRLLPGATHALIEHGNAIEVWDLQNNEGEVVGSTPMCPSYDLCLTFDVEVVNDGKGLVVAGVFVNIESCRCYIQISSFNMQTHQSSTLLERALPYVFVADVTVRGDIVLTQLPHEYGSILMNWRTAESVLVKLCDSSSAQPIRAKTSISESDIIFVVNLSSLMLISLPLSHFDGRWSQSPDPHHWENEAVLVPVDIVTPDSDSGSDSGPSRFSPDPDVPSKLILPYDKTELSDGPWLRVLHTFTSTQTREQQGALGLLSTYTEVIIVAFGYGRGRVTSPLSRRLLTYKVRIHPPTPTSTSEFKSEPKNRLELLKYACISTTDVPWDPYCVVNAGKMYELLDRRVVGFDLFPEVCLHGRVGGRSKLELNLEDSGVQVGPGSVPFCKGFDVDVGVNIGGQQQQEEYGENGETTCRREPMACVADPYSGTVAVSTPEVVRVFRFD